MNKVSNEFIQYLLDNDERVVLYPKGRCPYCNKIYSALSNVDAKLVDDYVVSDSEILKDYSQKPTFIYSNGDIVEEEEQYNYPSSIEYFIDRFKDFKKNDSAFGARYYPSSAFYDSLYYYDSDSDDSFYDVPVGGTFRSFSDDYTSSDTSDSDDSFYDTDSSDSDDSFYDPYYRRPRLRRNAIISNFGSSSAVMNRPNEPAIERAQNNCKVANHNNRLDKQQLLKKYSGFGSSKYVNNLPLKRKKSLLKKKSGKKQKARRVSFGRNRTHLYQKPQHIGGSKEVTTPNYKYPSFTDSKMWYGGFGRKIEEGDVINIKDGKVEIMKQ